MTKINYLGQELEILLSPEDKGLPDLLPGKLRVYRQKSGRLTSPRLVLGPGRRTLRLHQLIALARDLDPNQWSLILTGLRAGSTAHLDKVLVGRPPTRHLNHDPLDCQRENLSSPIAPPTELAPPTVDTPVVEDRPDTPNLDSHEIPDFLKGDS